MRKLSVTEYLIAANQQQSTVTTYARLSDALREVEFTAGQYTRLVADEQGEGQNAKVTTYIAKLGLNESIGVENVYYVANAYDDAHAAILAVYDDTTESTHYEIVML